MKQALASFAAGQAQDQTTFNQCLQNPSTWVVHRFEACVMNPHVVVTTLDAQTGQVVGTAVYAIFHGLVLDNSSAEWENFTVLLLENGRGRFGDAVASVNQCSQCSGIATGLPFPPQVLTPGNDANGGNLLSDNPINGAVDTGIGVSWTDSFTCSGGGCTVGSETFQLPDNAPVRCDNQANTGAAQGCANPFETPTLNLTGFSTGNASTAFVSFIQSNNVDHWGLQGSSACGGAGCPLHRLNNPAQGEANRDVMCQGFVKDPNVTDDSCDEYPFALTYESGAMQGLTAADCSVVTPQFNSGSWTFQTGPGYSPSQHCGIGHVSLSDNKADGGMYGRLIVQQRLIDLDPFWVSIQP